MTIYRTLMSALKKKSNYKGNWIRNAPPPKKAGTSRQQRKHAALSLASAAVNRENPSMPRAERRMLARAYAAGLMRDAVIARLAKKAAA